MWTQAHTDAVKEFAEEFGLNYRDGAGHPGLGRDRIHHGSNSGYQAINLAYLLGADRIILLGYDMQRTGGQGHFFGDHPKGLTNGHYEGFIPRFTDLARDLGNEGVDVINCTRETALHQFRREDFDSCIRRLKL